MILMFNVKIRKRRKASFSGLHPKLQLFAFGASFRIKTLWRRALRCGTLCKEFPLHGAESSFRDLRTPISIFVFSHDSLNFPNLSKVINRHDNSTRLHFQIRKNVTAFLVVHRRFASKIVTRALQPQIEPQMLFQWIPAEFLVAVQFSGILRNLTAPFQLIRMTCLLIKAYATSYLFPIILSGD